MNPATSNLLLGFLQDFIFIAGSIIVGAMTATAEIAMPRPAVVVLAIITGAIQASRRAQSKVDPPVGEPRPLDAQVKVTQDTIAHVVEQVTKNLQPVTPLRVEPPVPVKVQKDSS
jgi:hypothetical protein